MEPKLYFRNPFNYVREMVECGEYLISWDKGVLVKHRIDPVAFSELHYSTTYPWEALVVTPAGSAEYCHGDTIDKPSAVYPTWSYANDDQALLMEILEQPVGEDEEICSAKDCLPTERPVLGQPHKVIITDMPIASIGTGKRFLAYIKELQEDYPQATIHVHGLYGYRAAFGLGFHSVDVEPRTTAQKGKILLPNGREKTYEAAYGVPQWIKLMGMAPADLQVPRNRCMYNIKSARWAAQNYNRLYVFRTNKNAQPVDFETADAEFSPPSSTSPPVPRKLPVKEGDQLICDTCSLQDDCRYYRSGMVCAVPGSEPVGLSKMFRSRDAGTIIDGLGTVLGMQANRVQTGLQLEEAFGEQFANVSRDIDALFNNGVKLAKLIDPALRGNSPVQVHVGGSLPQQTPQMMVSQIVRDLESRGVAREDITNEMVMGVLEGMASEATARRAIEGTVIAREDVAS